MTREKRFLVDAMMGKLARFLRIFGYDTIYANDLEPIYDIKPMPDEKLLEISIEQDRIIITRDLPFHQMAPPDRTVYLNGKGVYNYLNQLKDKLGLSYNFHINQARCSTCNGMLIPVEDKTTLEDRVKETTLKFYDRFYRCQNCDKIFWRGSHIDKIIKKLKEK